MATMAENNLEISKEKMEMGKRVSLVVLLSLILNMLTPFFIPVTIPVILADNTLPIVVSQQSVAAPLHPVVEEGLVRSTEVYSHQVFLPLISTGGNNEPPPVPITPDVAEIPDAVIRADVATVLDMPTARVQDGVTINDWDFEKASNWQFGDGAYYSSQNILPGGTGGSAFIPSNGYVKTTINSQVGMMGGIYLSVVINNPGSSATPVQLALVQDGEYCTPGEQVMVEPGLNLPVVPGLLKTVDTVFNDSLYWECSIDTSKSFLIFAYNNGDQELQVDGFRVEVETHDVLVRWDTGSGTMYADEFCFDTGLCLAKEKIWWHGQNPPANRNHVRLVDADSVPSTAKIGDSFACGDVECVVLQRLEGGEEVLILVLLDPPVAITVGALLLIYVILSNADFSDVRIELQAPVADAPYNWSEARLNEVNSQLFLYQKGEPGSEWYPVAGQPVEIAGGLAYDSSFVNTYIQLSYKAAYPVDWAEWQIDPFRVDTSFVPAIWNPNPQEEYDTHLREHPERYEVWNHFFTITNGGYQQPNDPNFKSYCSLAFHLAKNAGEFLHTRHMWVYRLSDTEAYIYVWGENGRFVGKDWVSSGTDFNITAFHATPNPVNGNTWQKSIAWKVREFSYTICDVFKGPPMPPMTPAKIAP